MIQSRISYSEVERLTDCEQRWAYQYLFRQDRGEQTGAMRKGSLLHDVIGRWWETDLDIQVLLREAVSDWDLSDQSLAGLVNDTQWLLDRYQQVYFTERERKALTVVGSELKFHQNLPNVAADAEVVGYVDQLVLTATGGLWLVERKSMINWERLELLPVDRQVDIYIWLARACGLPVEGVLYDAIRTYRWKRDPHPPEDSVQLRWIDRTDDQIAETLDEVRSVMSRRAQLVFGARPTRRISRDCNRCPFQATCWEASAFPEIEIGED